MGYDPVCRTRSDLWALGLGPAVECGAGATCLPNPVHWVHILDTAFRLTLHHSFDLQGQKVGYYWLLV